MLVVNLLCVAALFHVVVVNCFLFAKRGPYKFSRNKLSKCDSKEDDNRYMSPEYAICLSETRTLISGKSPDEIEESVTRRLYSLNEQINKYKPYYETAKRGRDER